MKIPKDLQLFPSLTLLVASDTVHAKLFLVGGDRLEELDGIAVPKETGMDGEGSMEFFPDDAARLTQFIHRVTQHIETLARTHPIKAIHLVMPPKIAHAVSKQLAQDMKRKIGKIVPQNAVHASALEIVRRIVELSPTMP